MLSLSSTDIFITMHKQQGNKTADPSTPDIKLNVHEQ